MSTEPLQGLLASRVAPADPDPLIGSLAVDDTDLPGIEASLPIALVSTGGAGQIAGPAALAVRRDLALASLTTTLADPADPAGNVRRVVAAVDAARADGALPEETIVRVVLPAEPAGYGWQMAADEVAAAQFEVALPVVVGERPVPAPMVVEWIDALLDRETRFAALGAGSAEQVLGVLAATAAAWDGLGADEAAARVSTGSTTGAGSTTGSRQARPPGSAVTAEALATGRRWCRAVHVEDGPAIADALRAASS